MIHTYILHVNTVLLLLLLNKIQTVTTHDGEPPTETRTPSIANAHNVGGEIPRGVARRSLFFTRHQ